MENCRSFVTDAEGELSSISYSDIGGHVMMLFNVYHLLEIISRTITIPIHFLKIILCLPTTNDKLNIFIDAAVSKIHVKNLKKVRYAPGYDDLKSFKA